MKTDDEGEVEALYSATTPRPVTLFVVVLLAPHLNFSPCTSTHPKSISLELFTMPATKRKSDAMDVTPTGSPTKKMRLTQHQKQALMDNLQLESELKLWIYGVNIVLILLQSLSERVNFVLNMPSRQMTSGRALSDASIEFQSRFARPTSASSSKSTMLP